MTATVERIYDTGNADNYPAGLYDFNGIATGVETFQDITDDHINRFHEQGYLVVQRAFAPEEVQRSLAGLMHLISGGNPDFDGVQFEQAAHDIDVDSLPEEKRQDYVRKFMWFVNYDERLKAMAEHPELVSTVERLIGETPFLFQDMALIKPPRLGREKPWHQDHAYFELSLNARVVGAWIALDEATTDNGCMVIVPGSHREGPVVHFKRRDWQICDTEVRNQGAVAVPLRPGGCLFFSSLVHHGTPANHSGQRRRAIQFHYRPQSAPRTSAEERLSIFGSEGKDVTC